MTQKKPIENEFSNLKAGWGKFRRDFLAMTGLCGVVLLLALALLAPLLANSRPFFIWNAAGVSWPALRYFFAPDCSEVLIEQIFNYALLLLPFILLCRLFFRGKARLWCMAFCALVLVLPFILTGERMDRTDWTRFGNSARAGAVVIWAPVAFGPFEQSGRPYEKPGTEHWLGTDQIGRDVLARMLYGARVSLAVGLLATGIALVLGTLVGVCAGYFGGRFDLAMMRVVEVIICFPTFLLLLILMSLLKDRKFEQSIVIVILVIGLTGWTGLSRLVRGEVLKNRVLPYIQYCRAAGLPVWRIMVFHLLPNISGPILITFTFGVAGAIIAESGLSFLGFGVQPPTASWGGLLRQAFSDPASYWHLTLWPGLALFIAVCSFNFTGEGLRKVFDPKS